MIRKLCTLIVLMFTITGAFFAPQAVAQGEPTCAIAFGEDPITVPSPASTVVPVTGGTDDALAETATADTTATDSAVVASDEATAAPLCAEAEAYPGPFTNVPTSPSGPYAAPMSLSATSPATPVAAAVESTNVALAHSGSETFILAYLGTGLLAFGAVALGIRRGSGIE